MKDPAGGFSGSFVIAVVLWLAMQFQGFSFAAASSYPSSSNGNAMFGLPMTLPIQRCLESEHSLSTLWHGAYVLSCDEIEADSSLDDSNLEPPLIGTDQMALALEWTTELNHRLDVASRTAPPQPSLISVSAAAIHTPLDRHNVGMDTGSSANNDWVDHLRGGGGRVATTAPPYRIPWSSVHDHGNDHGTNPIRAATIFHEESDQGLPVDLQLFLHQLEDIVHDDDAEDDDIALERTLALLYLDRACSVATRRSQTTESATPTYRLPFCTPQTVRRLTLAAVLVAARAVRGDAWDLPRHVPDAWGVSHEACVTLHDGMRSALGDAGIFVTPDEWLAWKRQWNARFD